jgi:hypothetical protein
MNLKTARSWLCPETIIAKVETEKSISVTGKEKGVVEVTGRSNRGRLLYHIIYEG